MLDEHAIRFPEGRVPLEDQMFVMAAYLHARRITVLSDRIYYSYLRRVGSGRNAGDTPIDALRQSTAVEQVLDVVEQALDETGADEQFRDRILRRFYRINLLPRLVDAGVMTNDPHERDEVVDEVRRVTAARFGPGVTQSVGAAHRTLGHLLQADDTPALLAVGDEYRAVGLRAHASALRWQDGALHLDLDGGVTWHGELLRCEPTGSGWALPTALAPGVPQDARELDPVRDEADVEVSLISRATSASFAADSDVALAVDGDGVLRLRGHVGIDPGTALAGNPLEDGVWDLRVRMRFAGWNRTCTVRVPDAVDPLLPPLLARDGRALVAFLPRSGELTLDVGQWLQSLPQRVSAGSRLTVAGPATLVLDLPLESAAATAPHVEVVLESSTHAAAVVALSGPLTAAGSTATAQLPLPSSLRQGIWRPWLRLRDDVSPPERLPWTVQLRGDRVTVAPVAD